VAASPHPPVEDEPRVEAQPATLHISVGGKLFHFPRMPRADYLEREAAVRAYLDTVLPGGYRIPRFYGDKLDFGDMDVIVVATPDWGERRERIAKELGVDAVKVVGRVYSTAFRGLQTDFFAVPARFLDSTYDFMSFNDLGNLLGRIVRRFDLKWGEEGLAYVFRRASDDHYRADLPITQDFARVCAFLGLDHAAWVTGFPTLTSLYEWVIASPYFSVAPYLDDATTGTLAQRSKDRPTIIKFVEFLRARGIAARPAFAERGTYAPQIAAAFPEADLPAQLAAEHAKEARAKALAARFSGALVMRLRPELSGKALGEFIVAFKRALAGDGAFDDAVLATPPDELERRIAAFDPALAGAPPTSRP
jgi:hypothetical protein